MKHTICYMHFREEGSLPTYQNLHSFLLNLFKKNHLAFKENMDQQKIFVLSTIKHQKSCWTIKRKKSHNENPNNKTI